MRNKLFKFLAIVFVTFLYYTKSQAQTSCVVSGVNISVSGTYYGVTYWTPSNQMCTSAAFTGSGYWSNVMIGGNLVYTFSSPVYSVRINYTLIDGGIDVANISVNGGGVMTLSSPCGMSVAGSQVTGTAGTGLFSDTSITVTSTLPFTTITTTNAGTSSNTGYVQGNPCTFIIYPHCNAGTTAPALSAISITNVCPATTVNLNTLHSGSVPAFSGVSLVWFTNNTHTGAAYATPTTAGAGTYYAFYYDSVNNCYSPASSMITVTATPCCGVGLNVPILN